MATRVLLIDDQTSMTRVCGDMLRLKGFSVRVENDALQGLTAAQEFRPDVAVIDYRMPGMSGADLAWAFATSEDLSRLPIIILTGFPDALRASSLPPGKIQILAKPLSLRALLGAIEASLAGAPARE